MQKKNESLVIRIAQTIDDYAKDNNLDNFTHGIYTGIYISSDFYKKMLKIEINKKGE